VGETFGYELVLDRPGEYQLEVRSGGDLMVKQPIVIR
jgi:hypothetical protein